MDSPRLFVGRKKSRLQGQKAAHDNTELWRANRKPSQCSSLTSTTTTVNQYSPMAQQQLHQILQGMPQNPAGYATIHKQGVKGQNHKQQCHNKL